MTTLTEKLLAVIAFELSRDTSHLNLIKTIFRDHPDLEASLFESDPVSTKAPGSVSADRQSNTHQEG